MYIGELSKLSGLSKDGLRHYEALGLIHSSAKSAGTRSYRDYAPDTLERLELIRCGKAAGFSLKEIQPLLSLFMDKQLSPSQYRSIIEDKIQQLDARISAIEQMKQSLQAHL